MMMHCLLPLLARRSLRWQSSSSNQENDKHNKQPQGSDKQKINAGMRTRNELYLSFDKLASQPDPNYSTVIKVSSPANPAPDVGNDNSTMVSSQDLEKGLLGEWGSSSQISELPGSKCADSSYLLYSSTHFDEQRHQESQLTCANRSVPLAQAGPEPLYEEKLFFPQAHGNSTWSQ